MSIAIVLGGSSGLGLASAKRLATDGYKLCVVYREPRANQTHVSQAMAELAALCPSLLHFNADALSETGRNSVLDALERTLQSGDAVSVLIHSIAKGAMKPLNTGSPSFKSWPPQAAITPEVRTSVGGVTENHETDTPGPTQPKRERQELTALDVRLTVEAMGTSLLDWVNEIRARQLFAKDSRVLAFTSEGSHRVWPGYGAVSAAKATLEALVRSIAYELAPIGIRANCIQAGVTDTPALRHIPNSEQLKTQAVMRNPMGRLTTPEDVANVVALLCKPEAAWINGTVIIADGGEHLC